MQHELAQLGNGAHALAIQILGNRDDAADAVHDALLSVLNRPAGYDAGKGPLKPWFMRIVRNRCLDLLRRRRPSGEPVEEIADQAAGPEQIVETHDRDRVLELALAAIDPAQREIIVLRDYMDLSYADIARVLEIPQGTVMSRLHRARLTLAKAFKAYE